LLTEVSELGVVVGGEGGREGAGISSSLPLLLSNFLADKTEGLPFQEVSALPFLLSERERVNEWMPGVSPA
jgi:hypothetical protein